MITRLNDLLSVLQLTETRAGTYRNGPELTGMDRNGHTKLPKRTSVVPKRTLQCTETEQNVVSAHTETNTMGTIKGRPGNGQQQVYVCEVGR